MDRQKFKFFIPAENYEYSFSLPKEGDAVYASELSPQEFKKGIGGEFFPNYKHLIGEEVTYIGLNNNVTFNVPDPNSDNEYWKYKEIDSTPLKYKKFKVVDAASGWI